MALVKIKEDKRYKYLFLDRDGVINEERPDDYAKSIEEFVFIPGVLQAIARLSSYFDKIFIITNQRGIGRKIFSETDLENIHQYMLSLINQEGGRIDKIYYCTDVNESSINRKPNVGMAFQVQRDFPEVNFNESIFVGNSKSDIQFGNKLGMFTVLVGDKYEQSHIIYKNINAFHKNLAKFADSIIASQLKTDK